MTRKRRPSARREQKTAPPLETSPETAGAGAPPSYPSPAERKRIVARRDQIMKELIRLLFSGREGDKYEMEKLKRRFGSGEVARVIEIVSSQSSFSKHLIDHASGCRHYRLGFARFGGARPLLPCAEVEDLSIERALLYGRREFKDETTAENRAREEELDDLLQMDWHFWDDIVPLDVPARPENFPAPARYPAPFASLLDWGWDLDLERISLEAPRWKAHERGLEKIVFDESLRNGWPGEPASWAPWHALRLLGRIGAFGSARRLAGLCDLPNDWLSDLLPEVWTDMGAPAEISLWDILDDRGLGPHTRGLAAFGLQNLVKNESLPRLPIVKQLAERLSPQKVDHPDVTAYILAALDRLESVEVKSAIRAAFEKNLVNTRIITVDNFDFLNEEI